MKFHYHYRNTTLELWQLSMYYIYGSLIGVCNLIFTGAMFALVYSKWSVSDTFFRILMIVGCCLFTVFQPVSAYRKAAKQAASIKEDTDIGFDDTGMYLKVGEKSSRIRWNQIKRISKKPTMVVIFSDTAHGYVLTDRILGADKASFYDFIASKIQK